MTSSSPANTSELKQGQVSSPTSVFLVQPYSTPICFTYLTSTAQPRTEPEEVSASSLGATSARCLASTSHWMSWCAVGFFCIKFDVWVIVCLPSGKPTGDHVIEHTDKGYHCATCNLTGSDLKCKPCSGKPDSSKGPGEKEPEEKVEEKATTMDESELLLEQLLQEELELAQMLEESMALSLTQPHVDAVVPADKVQDQEDPELQKALEMSLQDLPKADSNEDDLAEAIALSMTCPTSSPEEPAASSPEAGTQDGAILSGKDLYNMQLIVNMGFTKGQAIWGVKRANQGNGSVDLALQHASWKCDAEILMAKRQKLDELVCQSRPLQPQEVVGTASSNPAGPTECHVLSKNRYNLSLCIPCVPIFRFFDKIILATQAWTTSILCLWGIHWSMRSLLLPKSQRS